MIRFKSQKVKKHIVFEELNWRLDKYPLTVIRGIDRDAKINTSNRVGKSLLPATLATLLTDAPPINVKKKSAKDLVKNKAVIELAVANNATQYDIKQFASGQSVKYQIKVDGIDQEIKDIKIARELIAKAVPLSPEHVFSQLYVSSYRPSVLLYGSAASRLAYFEKIFDVRVYDQLRQVSLLRLQAVNKNFIKFNLLKSQKHELPDVTADKSAAKLLKQIKSKYQKIMAEYTRAHKSAQELTKYVSIAEQIYENSSIKQLEKKLAFNKKQLQLYRSLLSSEQKQNAKIELALKHAKQRRELQKQLKQLNYVKIGNKLAKLQHKTHKIEQQLKEYQKYEKHIERYNKFVSRYNGIKSQSIEALQTKLGKAHFRLKQNIKLKHAKKCPLCRQPIKNNPLRNVKKLRRTIKNIEQSVKTSKIVDYINKVQNKIPANILQLHKANEHLKLEKLNAQLQALQQQTDINDEFDRIRSELKRLPKAELVEQSISVKKLDDYERKIAKFNKSIVRITSDIELVRKLNKLGQQNFTLKSAKKALLLEQQVVSKLTPKLEKTNQMLEVLTKRKTNYKNTVKQLHRLDKQLGKLDRTIADKDILEALVKAYSSKGIRLIQVQSLVDAYVHTLNQFANYIYPHNIKFYSQIGPNKCDIIAERGTGISDVRMLSGAESRQFLALSALALISLMPDHLRCNLLILDELEAGLSPVNRKKFALDFIPILKQYVENLVIITPHNIEQFYIPDAKELMLVRENNVTTWSKS